MWSSIAISVSSGFSAPVQPQIETSGSIFHLIYIPFHSLFSVLQISSPRHPTTLDWFGLAPNWDKAGWVCDLGFHGLEGWEEIGLRPAGSGDTAAFVRAAEGSQRGWGSGGVTARGLGGAGAACALHEGSEGSSSSSSSSSRGGRALRAGPTEPCAASLPSKTSKHFMPSVDALCSVLTGDLLETFSIT